MDIEIFLLSFIPLFVALDIIGVAPIFLGHTKDLSDKETRKLIFNTVVTVFIVAIIFLFGGRAILSFLGITIDDFRIAGGIILLILSITDILFSTGERRKPQEGISIVPIGIPLIMGPAALTTIIILVDNYGYIPAIVSIILNFIIVAIVLLYSKLLIKLIGRGGAEAFAKIAALFLAAIAVMMIRVGVINIFLSIK